jgi:hypothetical protein
MGALGANVFVSLFRLYQNPDLTSTLFRRDSYMIRNLGFILLAIYLILVAVALIFSILTPSVLLGIIALAAAVFILIGK